MKNIGIDVEVMGQIMTHHRTKCLFCKMECAESHHDVLSDWNHCIGCQSSFYSRYDGEIEVLFLSCIINDKTYQIELNYTMGTTRIVILPDDPVDTILNVADFPYLLRNITPDNVAYKIKTSVLFS